MSRKVVPLLALALVAGCGGGSAKQAAGTPGSTATGSTPGVPTASPTSTFTPTSTPTSTPTGSSSSPAGPGAPSASLTTGGGSTSGGTSGRTGGTGPAPGPVVPSAAPGVYSGVGNGVVTVSRSISGDTALAHVVSRTAQALHVEAANIGGTTVLVDTATAYAGVRAFNSSGGDTTLSVRASGPWSITVTPAASARRFTTVARGVGDDVVLYAGSGTQARITGGGAGRLFRVDANADRIVDTTSSYARTLPITLSDGKVLFEVQAAGPWTIAVS